MSAAVLALTYLPVIGAMTAAWLDGFSARTLGLVVASVAVVGCAMVTSYLVLPVVLAAHHAWTVQHTRRSFNTSAAASTGGPVQRHDS